MAAPKIYVKERDLTARVKAFGGVYNAILINAKKGDVGVPTLVSNEEQLLRYFTPNEKVEVGYDLSYYSALAVLQQTNKLWVVRVANGAKYGGVNVFSKESGKTFTQFGETSPYLKELTFDVTKIETHQDKITIASVKDKYGNILKAGDLLDRIIQIDGAEGVYTVLNVANPDDTSSEVTLDRPIDNGKPYLLGTGSGSVEAVSGIEFDITNVDTTTESSTVLTLANFVNGSIADLHINDPIYITDGNVYKEYVIKDIDSANSTVTIDGTGDASFLGSVNYGRNSYPQENLSVSVKEGSNEISVSGLKGKIEWLANRNIALALNVSDGSVYNDIKTIGEVDSVNLKLIVSEPVNYPVNDFSLPVKGKSNEKMPTAEGYDDPVAAPKDENALFWIFQKDPGEWSKDIRIEIITDPEIVKEPDAFMINVYKKNNVYAPVESFVVSRIPGKKDGYGRNIYIEDALKSSNYIRAINNTAIDASVMPVEIKKPEFIFMVAGDDGLPVTESNYINAVKVFENKNNYPVTLLLDGGVTLPGYQKELVRIAETRKNCFAILSVPYSAEMSSDYANEIVKYRKKILNVDSSYAALFSSHLIIVDKYNDRDLIVSPDGFAAGAINYSAENFEIWYPPAGQRRGKIFAKDIIRKFTDGEMSYLYDNGINPIRYFPGKGITIWGQKTLSSRPSALDRINVRMLLIVIENSIAEFLEDFLFELNDDLTGKLIEIQISNYMDSIKARKGVVDYYVVSDETNNTPADIDNHIRNVDLYIKPAQSIEWIYFTTVLTPTGLSFKDAQLMA